MTIQHIANINGRLFAVKSTQGLGSGRHYRTVNTVSGKVVARNLITGKFKREN